jgi:hypothetical protein
MPQDAYIGLAPDGPGKRVDMDSWLAPDGVTYYRQRAVLVGLTAEQLDELVGLNRAQLTVLRAILASINSSRGTTVEGDFDANIDYYKVAN